MKTGRLTAGTLPVPAPIAFGVERSLAVAVVVETSADFQISQPRERIELPVDFLRWMRHKPSFGDVVHT